MSKYSDIAPKSISDLRQHFGKTYDYIYKNDEVLDVGCSSGYYSRLLIKDKNCAVDGIEINDDDREVAQKYLRKVFNLNLDDENWPKALISNKYDVVFLGDVIEHVINAGTVLTKLKNMLKPGGRIIISTPNIAHLTIRLELLCGNFEYERTGILDETHLKYFTLGSLTRLLQDIGLSIKDVDYSLNDLHPDTIKHQLKLSGLAPRAIFWKNINTPEARAYQWKIVTTQKQKGVKTTKIAPPLKPSQNNFWFLGQVEKLTRELAEQKVWSEKLTRELAEQKVWSEKLTRELAVTRKSLAWRIENKLRSITKKK